MALSDDSGDAVNTYDYDASGAVRAFTGSQPNVFKFTDEQVDAGTEMEYLRARYPKRGLTGFGLYAMTAELWD